MLQVKDLCYDVIENGQKITLLKDVSFDVQDGEMLVITGPNGGGKSTMAKVLMGISRATGGQILLDGTDLSEMSIDERANAGIGFAFQQPPIFKGMTVARLLNLAAGETLPEKVCCKLLSNVGLCAKEYINREVDATLSGGERKRIEIATVLAKQHKICIFDEPEAGIDLWSFARLTETFKAIHEKREATLLIISHQERIINLADEIVMISDGRVSKYGPKEEIFPQILANTLSGCSYMTEGAAQ